METNEQVAEKVRQSLKVGLHPIICVGESLEQREADKTFKVIEEQLSPVFKVLEDFDTSLEMYHLLTSQDGLSEQESLLHQSRHNWCMSR